MLGFFSNIGNCILYKKSLDEEFKNFFVFKGYIGTLCFLFNGFLLNLAT